jgi:hypothetical protein
MAMQFELTTLIGVEPINVDVDVLLLAGYTGRDQAAVRAHIEELERHGVSAPSIVPTVYAVPATRLSTASRIAVHGERTSGEAEFVLCKRDGHLLVGVASDHTDRELEEYSVVKSKQGCDKPISFELWSCDDVSDHWDQLVLSADVLTETGPVRYQEGTLDSLMSRDSILEEVKRRAGTIDRAMVFSGTLPLIGGEFRYGQGFRAQLLDPVLNRSLVCEYTVEVLRDL